MSTVATEVIPVAHFVKGEIVTGTEVEYRPRDSAPFATPKLDLDSLVYSRAEPPPAADVPYSEIIELLMETGDHLRRDPEGFLAEALENMVRTSPMGRPVLEWAYGELWRAFDRERIEFQVKEELGGPAVLDGWREVVDAIGRKHGVRAYSPRLVQIIAGNAPGVSVLSVINGAITKSVSLFKLPSNDLFTATAVLRSLAAVAPGHPVTRSFSAAYWRGGDDAVEGILFRPQFFDKVVAWGGESTIKSAVKYLGPGFELVSFDPKTSMSLIGKEAFTDEFTLEEAAAEAAIDATFFNQFMCAATRFIYLEASVDEADRFCQVLQREMAVERPSSSPSGPSVAAEMRDEIDALRMLEPHYRIFGGYEGEGLVIRSEDPVEFYPENKVVNVVPVRSLHEALRYANVSTQTVGVYPPSRKAEVRDALAAAGTQRVVRLGRAGAAVRGLPHDGFYPLNRFVRWVNDED
jgi:acyl-CoA reductase-like NAD-dependent aldehyde dehydrogenase